MSVIGMPQPTLEPPVSPRDCALLIGAPLTRESFLADLDRPDKDFAKSFQRERPNLNEEALWRAYEPYAALAKAVCARVSELGVVVIDNATLADFHRTAPGMPVITLVGHWRSARFRDGDILDVKRVSQYVDPTAAAAASAELLAEALNQLLDRPNAEYDDVVPGSFGELVALQYKWQAARTQIERQLNGAVCGGAAVEFADGFRGVAEILNGLPLDFSGVLDLTVCQSVLLGEEVKRRCRHCLVLTAADLTTLDYRFALYRQTVEVLASQPQPYQDAIVGIRKLLNKKYGKKSK